VTRLASLCHPKNARNLNCPKAIGSPWGTDTGKLLHHVEHLLGPSRCKPCQPIKLACAAWGPWDGRFSWPVGSPSSRPSSAPPVRGRQAARFTVSPDLGSVHSKAARRVAYGHPSRRRRHSRCCPVFRYRLTGSSGGPVQPDGSRPPGISGPRSPTPSPPTAATETY
jgi:hypothetical protein